MEKDSTKDSYRGTLTRFIAAALRSIGRAEVRCRLPLTEDIKVEARKLLGELKKYQEIVKAVVEETPRGRPPPTVEVPDTLTRQLQHLFFRCVTGMVEEAEDERFRCPVQVYMACYGYNEDDTFRTPPEVTSVLAVWQFLLRGTALYESWVTAEADETTSALR